MTLYTQYNNATNLNNLLFGTNTYEGLSQLINLNTDDFYTNYFDIDTCNSDGLNNWGYLLDISNSYTIPDYNNIFGFGDELGLPPVTQTPYNYPQNFGHGNFWGGQSKIIAFTDDEYRLLLKLKYRILVSNYSYSDIIDIINKFVQSIDPSYQFILIQNGTKKLIYKFNFTFKPTEDVYYQIIKDSYLLPVPMGVEYEIQFLS